MIKVFLSYSHANEQQKEALDKHLAVLKRSGQIESWNDRMILAGTNIDNVIDKSLLESKIIILLVSADFLASDYCYSVEMARAFEMREQGTMHIIPVILDHCDWKNTPLGKILAVPKDGNPVSEFPNTSKAYSEITDQIRKVIDSFSKPDSKKIIEQKKQILQQNKPSPQIVETVRSSNLNIKREFTDLDKDTFRKEGYDYIFKFFNNSLRELKSRNSNIETMFHPEDRHSFVAYVYRNGKIISQCLITRKGGKEYALADITISTSASRNSCNGGLTIENNDVELYFEPFSGWGTDVKHLSIKGGAEYLWNMFMEPMQR